MSFLSASEERVVVDKLTAGRCDKTKQNGCKARQELQSEQETKVAEGSSGTTVGGPNGTGNYGVMDRALTALPS